MLITPKETAETELKMKKFECGFRDHGEFLAVTT